MSTTRVDRTRPRLVSRCYTRRVAVQACAAGIIAATLASSTQRVGAQVASPVASTPNDAGTDFTGLIDIGGRNIYMESRGSGNPTVVLLAGGRSSARYWSDDLLHPDAPRAMVLSGVAAFTRVVAYDRPGTYAEISGEIFPSRSDPLPQPRTAPEMVAELHMLLQAAEIPGPYVLAGHSFGGFCARLYAATYPDDVVGLVLIDAFSELLEDAMSPGRWQALEKLNQGLGSDGIHEIPGYGDAETTGYGANNAVVRAAVAVSPLPPMPLAVLAHGKAFKQSDSAPGFEPGELEGFLLTANKAQAALVPDGRFSVAAQSGHDVHQDQPQLVVEAIRQVVEGVRYPDSWYSLTACCAE